MASMFTKSSDNFDFDTDRTCRNCGNTFKGRFCNLCGEKVIENYDRSAIRFIENMLSSFTFVEGKFLRSFRLLVLYPGRLSGQISSGVQVPYMSLMAMFFFANFIYFIFPGFDTFNSSLYSQFYQQDHSDIVQTMVRSYINTSKTDVKEFTQKYNAESTNLSKLLLIIMVVILSFVIMLFNIRKKKLWFDHLLASFEFNTFMLLINSVLIPFIFSELINFVKNYFEADWSSIISDTVYSTISQCIFAYFFLFLQKNFYNDNIGTALFKALILSNVVFYVWKLYRFILFLITFWVVT